MNDDDVGKNYRATVLKEIAHIHFTRLIILHLGKNMIESVEGLPHVQMEHLQWLNLSTYDNSIGHNNITSVRVVRKVAWPALSTLNIRT